MSRRIYTQLTNNANNQRWRCTKCGKVLSSKRSFDEHMNVHNGKRPFDCPDCKYSAASQMTLRRHKLRNHTPKVMWGYQCAYCSESYMEPASYQQHVISRHSGLSCTFGCTFCRFDTKSSKHFRKHMLKHLNVVSRQSRAPEADPINIAEFLIDDENGRGHCLGTKEALINKKPTISSSTSSNTAFLECGPDFFKTPLESKGPSKSIINRQNSKQTKVPKSLKQDNDYILISKQDGFEEYFFHVDDYDASNVPEMQNEVVIDESETYKVPPKEVVDFGLD